MTITQDEQWSGNLARDFSLLLSQINSSQFQSFFKGSEVSRSEFSRSEVSRSEILRSRGIINAGLLRDLTLGVSHELITINQYLFM